MAATQRRIGPGLIQQAADDEGGIFPRLAKNRSDHACRRCLAVRPGDRDAKAIPHQLRQHLSTGYDRYSQSLCCQALGVVLGHRRRHNQHVCLINMLCPVADMHGHTQRAQPVNHGGLGLIRTRHGVTQTNQYFGDTAHACAADTHHEDMTNAAHAAGHHWNGLKTLHGPPP